VVDNRIEDCETDGWAPEWGEGQGGGIWILNSPSVTVEDNWIARNQSLNGAGAYVESSNVIFRGNVFWANHDSTNYEENPLRGRGGGLCIVNSTGVIEQNTIVGNIALVVGSAVFVRDSPSMLMRANIFACNEGDGAGLCWLGAPPITYECNDAWGNTPENYGGWADPTGTDGNISLDPVFCLPETGNFALRDDSPCLPENSPEGCERIGAFGLGCSVNEVSQGDSAPFEPWIEIHPNPSLDRVVIRCGPHDWVREARVEILDVTGRCIRTLRGEDVVHWDRRTESGKRASSGMYFVMVRDRSKTRCEKLIVVD
jgi:hypothetical protein